LNPLTPDPDSGIKPGPAPTVSVIIPCYNGAAFLRETVDSALRQTIPPLDVIVVDDGSTDDSAAIAESYGPLVRVIRQRNQGESVARNVGIAAARGDYLMFLDADDLLAPDALQKLAIAIRDVPQGVALMGFATFESDPSIPLTVSTPTWSGFFPGIIQTNPGFPHCWLTSKAMVLRAGGFTTTMQNSEDWEFCAKLALAGGVLIPLNYVGAYYRRHAKSQSSVMSKVNRARGHVEVMLTLGRGILAQKALLEQYGDQIFWGARTILQIGRSAGLSWTELRPLRRIIRDLILLGPDSIRETRSAKLIRWIGTPLAETVRNWMVSDRRKVPKSRQLGVQTKEELNVHSAS
jgi:glycosyltransferase involved in cell wall biosynthesis